MVVATKRRTSVNGADEAAPPKKKELRVLKPLARVIVVPIQSKEGCPLVMQKFSEKAQRMMAAKQQHKATGPRAAKDPKEHYQGSMHLMPDAKATDDKPDLGFPAGGFRKAMIAAATYCGIKPGVVKAACFVVPDGGDMVRIEYKKIKMRDDVRKNESGVADIRYRPEISNWRANVTIEYDEALISAEQVVNLMHRAGFSIGIGEERPGRKGEWGRWEVLQSEEGA